MRDVTLVLIVHDHQPVGNFDGVFAQAYADAYAPFLAFLETHPAIRLALHTSGPLLEWIGANREEYLPRLRARVASGQIEPWGGGWFEPVLPAIPEHDRRGQIAMMARWIETELGAVARGLWLTERVWEPGLASSLSAAGVEYTAVDDAHFVAAGFDRDALWGYFQTEDQGLPLKVFPIHRELRYLVPFAEPERTIDLLRRVSEGGEGRIAVLGDDGEKFGVWPGTHALCYERGWLDRFGALLAENPWIRIATPSEAVARHAPLGLAYLPSASYHEMQEWALPPAAQARYHEAARVLAERFGDEAHDLLRGGHWRNFQARYPESNRLHKRALRASHRLWAGREGGGPAWQEARTGLWRAQCNCPYWHGVFGGLYLPHLRAAVYQGLIAAEGFLAPATARVERGDLDLDGFDDALLETREWAAWTSARGARLWAFDDRRALCNYGDTLARRPESYHAALSEAVVGGGDGESIHGAMRAKEHGLDALAGKVDAHGRDSFVDRWSEAGVVAEWAETRFDGRAAGEDEVVMGAPEAEGPALEKCFRVGQDGALEVEYRLGSTRARLGKLTVELNLGLHVPQADDRFVEIDGARATPPHFGATSRHESVSRTAFVDAWAGRRLDVWTDRRATFERAPIETVSQSESGAERVFQGLEARYTFAVALEPSKGWRLRFRIAPGRAATA